MHSSDESLCYVGSDESLFGEQVFLSDRVSVKPRLKDKKDIMTKKVNLVKEEKKRKRREKTLLKIEKREEQASKKAKKRAYKIAVRRLSEERRSREFAERHFGMMDFVLSEDEQVLLLAKQQRHPDSWLNLDNAALIFPAAENADFSNMFRLSAVMREPVKPLKLQEALNELVPRFPSMTSALKRGLFWFYLEPSNKPLAIEKQRDFPCRKIPVDSRHPLIRVTYYGCEISVEFFHSATDGTGGTAFLNSLIATYLRLCGCNESGGDNCPDSRDRPRAEELVDSFQTCFDKSVKGSNNSPAAYNYKMRRLPATTLVLVKGIAKGSELKAAAKKFNATVGELLTGVYIYSFKKALELYGKRAKKPIVISVPVNLRRLYASVSLRNFVSMMSVAYNGECDLERIIESCKAQFREQYTREFFDKLVGYNVWGQHFFLIKILPLPIKRMAMKIMNLRYGDRVRTSTLSNLGNVTTPDYFKQYVLRYEFSLGSQVRESIDLTCATFNDICTMTFTKTTAESDIERFFFTTLSGLGVEVSIETNFDPNSQA